MPDDRAANVQADETTVLARDTNSANAAPAAPPSAPSAADPQNDSGNLQSAQALGAVQYGTLIADDRTFAGEAPNQVDAAPSVAGDFVGVPGGASAEGAAAEAGAATQVAQAGTGGALEQGAAAQGNAGAPAQMRAAAAETGTPNVVAGQTTQTASTAGPEAPVVAGPGPAIEGASGPSGGAAASSAGTEAASLSAASAAAPTPPPAAVPPPVSAVTAPAAPAETAASAPSAAPPVPDSTLSELRDQLLGRLRELDSAPETQAALAVAVEAPPEGIASAPIVAASDVTGTEDVAIALDLSAALTDTDGSETLSVTISGVPAGASLSAGIDNGDGTWTLEAPELDGLFLTPPVDFAGNIALTIAATSLERVGGATTTTTSNFSVTVAGDADTPTLSVANVSGTEDNAIALNISSALSDTSETLSVTVSGVPTGATLSAGTNNGDGTWTLAPTQLTGLSLTPPSDYSGTINLSVTATSTDGTDTASTTSNFSVTVAGDADTPTLSAANV
ncbi:MAG: hypothetical protein ACKO1J_18890, partial [Tagaea sp.]